MKKFFEKQSNVSFMVGSLFTVIAIVLFIVWVKDTNLLQKAARTFKVTTATVTDYDVREIETEVYDEERDRYDTVVNTYYDFQFSYEANGSTYTGERRNISTWYGETFQIQYHTDDPEQYIIVAEMGEEKNVLFAALFFIFFGVVILKNAVRDRKKEHEQELALAELDEQMKNEGKNI